MKCKFGFDDINDYFDGIMSQEMKKKIEEHITMCEDCCIYYKSLLLTREFIEEKIGLNKDFRKTTLQLIDKSRYTNNKPSILFKRTLSRMKPVLKPAIVAAAVCVCLLMVYSNSYVMQDGINALFGNDGRVAGITCSTPTPSVEINSVKTKDKDIRIPDKETQHFKIYRADADTSDLDALSAALEGYYNKISSDMNHDLNTKVTIRIWSDIKKLHTEIGNPDASDSVISGSIGTTIHLLSPSAQKGKEFNDIGIHELAHIMIADINPDNKVLWMHEGIEGYEAGEFNRQEFKPHYLECVKNDDIPTVSGLSSNYKTIDFGFACSLVEFILEEYGSDKLKELVEDSKSFSDIFGCRESEFHENWVSYLSANYS